MSTLRFRAIAETLNRKPLEVKEAPRRSATFGSNVFNESTMRQYLTKEAQEGVMNAILKGTKID
ncbi:MAG: hypothetical protein R3213_09005, partial [Flavobacteriaceae bacterium]|nr:hypothetical protein [Flavobacteriaceae bacterium]